MAAGLIRLLQPTLDAPKGLWIFLVLCFSMFKQLYYLQCAFYKVLCNISSALYIKRFIIPSHCPWVHSASLFPATGPRKEARVRWDVELFAEYVARHEPCACTRGGVCGRACVVTAAFQVRG